MWSQPATARQVAALKANGNHDGKFYRKGRAGQTIGESVRAAGTARPTRKPPSDGSAGRSPTPVSSDPPMTRPGTISRTDPARLPAEILPALPAIPHAPAAAPRGTGQPVEQQPASGGWFSLFDELEQRHLATFRAKHYSYRGDDLREEIEAWASLRIKLAKQLVDANAKLSAILSNVPAGAIPDPAATAWQLLDAAYPHGHEEQHLLSFLYKHYSYRGDDLREEIEGWVNLRIRLAEAKARELVDMLNDQARRASNAQLTALPQATGQHVPKATRPIKQAQANPRRQGASPDVKGSTFTATVASTNPHGAVLSLDNGQTGWLHVSNLRALNNGAWVESVTDVLEVGQELRVRSIGTTARGQIGVELVKTPTLKPGRNNAMAAAAKPLPEVKPPLTDKPRRGLLKWSTSGRSGKGKA